jgi:alanine racemase
LATIPIGYADGVRRDLGLRGGQVLIRGRRHPIMGVVTMDQLVVADSTHSVEVGDEVVLIGAQGTQSISVDEVANALDTITYEIATSLGPRLPRRRGSGSALRDLRS